MVNSFAGLYNNRMWRHLVAEKKRERVRRGSGRRGSARAPAGLTREQYRFYRAQHATNQQRSREEMTVADMISLVYNK